MYGRAGSPAPGKRRNPVSTLTAAVPPFATYCVNNPGMKEFILTEEVNERAVLVDEEKYELGTHLLDGFVFAEEKWVVC